MKNNQKCIILFDGDKPTQSEIVKSAIVYDADKNRVIKNRYGPVGKIQEDSKGFSQEDLFRAYCQRTFRSRPEVLEERMFEKYIFMGCGSETDIERDITGQEIAVLKAKLDHAISLLSGIQQSPPGNISDQSTETINLIVKDISAALGVEETEKDDEKEVESDSVQNPNSLSVAIYKKEDGGIGIGFVLPAKGGTNGHECVSSEYKDGMFGGTIDHVYAGNWIGVVHFDKSKKSQWFNIDATNTENKDTVKILCSR